MPFFEVRCPVDRPHVSNGVHFPLCGHIVGALNEESDHEQIFFCNQCGRFLKAKYDAYLKIEILPRKIKLNLSKNWKQISTGWENR